MTSFFPATVPSHQIQRSYRAVFDKVKKDQEPVVILTQNTPDVVILDLHTYQNFLDLQEKYEVLQAKEAIKEYREENQNKKLKKLNSLKDLL